MRLSNGEERIAILQANVERLVVDARAGDDRITVAGDHPYTAGVAVNGGNPDSGSDVLVFVGSGNDVTIVPDDPFIQETGFGIVEYVGIEILRQSRQ